MARPNDSDEARANRLASMTRVDAPIPAPGGAGAGAHQGRSRLKGAATLERARIIPDPGQPRTEFDEEALEMLAASLRERGQLQPIRCRWDEGRGLYVIVLGERRWRAAALAGLESLDVIVDDEPATPEDLLEDQMVENCLRQDLRPMEQARAYRRLMDARGISLRGLAERLHVSPAAISKALATLELPEAIRESVDAGAIKPDIAYHLTQVHDPADQAALAARVVAEGLSRAETVEAVKKAAGRPRATSSRGRGVRNRKVTERAFKTEGGTRVTLENRKGLDGPAIVAALREATAKAEAEMGGDQVAA
jgi:ParB family chromosome partitioning protein